MTIDDTALNSLATEMDELDGRDALTEEEFFRIYDAAKMAAGGDSSELEPFLLFAKPEWYSRIMGN